MHTSLIALIAASLGNYVPEAPAVTMPDLTFNKSNDIVRGSPANTQAGTLTGKTAGSTMTVIGVAKNGVPISDISGLFTFNASGTVLLLGLSGGGLAAAPYTVTYQQVLAGAANSPQVGVAVVNIVEAGVVVPVGTLSLPFGTLTRSGVRVNAANKLADNAQITGGDAGHFTISGGYVTVTSAGATAKLNAGPYTIGISGDANYTSIKLTMDSAPSAYCHDVATFLDAYNTAPLTSYSRVVIPDGVFLQKRQPTDPGPVARMDIAPRGFTGQWTDPNYMKTREQIIAAGTLDAVGTYTGGGWVEITCPTYKAGGIDQQLSYGALRGVLWTNLAFIFTGFATVVVPAAAGNTVIMGDGTSYKPGSGYPNSGTWTWGDSSGAACSGTWTATNGVITAAAITLKNALAEAALDQPIVLQNAPDGQNGLHGYSSGTGGTIFLVKTNYAKGKPPAASTNALATHSGINSMQASSGSNYPSGFADIMMRRCFFGGDITQPDKAGMWTNGLWLRWFRRGLIEDCEFKGLRNCLQFGHGQHATVRRNDFQRMTEDALRFYSSSPELSPQNMAQGTSDDFSWVTIQVHDNAMHNNYAGLDFQSYHSDGVQIGTYSDYFGYSGDVFNNRIIFPNGSTQGFYNDDGVGWKPRKRIRWINNIAMTGAQNHTSLFNATSYEERDEYRANLYLTGPSAVAGWVFGLMRGAGGVFDKNVAPAFFDSLGYDLLSHTINNGGTGYLSTDLIVVRAGETYSTGNPVVDGNGKITNIIWNLRQFCLSPNGLLMQDVPATQTKPAVPATVRLDDASNTGEVRNAAKTGTGPSLIYSNTGSGASITLTADRKTQIRDPDTNAIVQDGFSTTTKTNVTLTGHDGYMKVDIGSHVYISQLDVSGARSWPENFVGPFTRVDELSPDGSTQLKGWSFPVDHSSRQALFSSVDAVFTPKPGGPLALAGAGHLVAP